MYPVGKTPSETASYSENRTHDGHWVCVWGGGQGRDFFRKTAPEIWEWFSRTPRKSFIKQGQDLRFSYFESRRFSQKFLNNAVLHETLTSKCIGLCLQPSLPLSMPATSENGRKQNDVAQRCMYVQKEHYCRKTRQESSRQQTIYRLFRRGLFATPLRQ